MKRAFRTVFFLLAMLVAFAPQALAAERQTFVVLPFTIQGPEGFAYLERAIPPMFNSRLYWRGQLEPAVMDLPASQPAVGDEAEAEKARLKYKADYVIWGTVSVIGDQSTLDVRVRDRSGKVWPQSRTVQNSQFIGAVSTVIDNMNQEVFGRGGGQAAAQSPARQGGIAVNQMNPDLMINESTSQQTYLNPEFRYSGNSGMDQSRLRSKALPYTAIGMEVVDGDGDGKNEIFVLSDTTLYAYRFDQDGLKDLAQYKFPSTSQPLNLRALPRSTGTAWLVVSVIDKDDKPISQILSFNGNSFEVVERNIKYYLNVVKLPPDYRPTLIGQQNRPPRMFRPGVYEMVKIGSGYTTGKKIDLPEDANVFNFSFIPRGRHVEDSEKILVYSPAEKLRLYTNTATRLSESDESYSGSALGLEVDSRMPGMGSDSITIKDMFYIPMRLLVVDLDRDGNHEVIVNKPISTASQFFHRYRFFPQSEIHALFWDGMGMNLQWKTRRIKGSMADYTIADANNDGILDLVTCVNSHPGALGVEQRRAMIVLYPLDLSKTDAPVSDDDFYE